MSQLTNPQYDQGICCPKCGSDATAVKDSRPFFGTVKRRRVCLVCDFRFTTEEVVRPEQIK